MCWTANLLNKAYKRCKDDRKFGHIQVVSLNSADLCLKRTPFGGFQSSGILIFLVPATMEIYMKHVQGLSLVSAWLVRLHFEALFETMDYILSPLARRSLRESDMIPN